MAERSGIPFGQKEPPLTDQIVNILGRYPDGGQILKELIQNADDAKAREVKFLYDGRSFGKKYLATEHLQKYQGPALYAFNDAEFQSQDWEGIQNLMRSNKKYDKLKVGRFGIGFNSVYHITDLPGIVSGDKIGFLDPHKECFGNGHSGKQYDISSSLLESDFRDQFKPFQGVFDFDFHKNYKSTLFRFPLRTYPSKLSQTMYTKEKVDKLFKSLYEEASIILLFMKNVQHISAYECIDGDKIKCTFKVEIAREMCEVVKQERQVMLKNADEKDLAELSYIIDVHLSSESGTKCFKWLVLNQIGLEGNESMTALSQKLSLPPWVGCAVPLNENAQKEDSGRIFCFLPLPRDVDCQTGLPVLVHGAFGVTDNRRGLLWPGSECQNNETADWNVLLVEKILSSVIYNALKSIITDCPVTGLNEIQRRELVYSIVPKLNGVIGHWNSVLDPLFQRLTQLNLFHAQSSSGTSWIILQEGLLDQMEKDGVPEETRNAVLKTLLINSKVVITDLPHHVSEIVEKYFEEKQDITSEFFRNFLRNNSIETASRDYKLLLLDYVLYDDPQPAELTGIPLLPLASGKFVTFTKHRHDSDPSLSVFVSDGSCTEDLLPNMDQDRFLDKNIPTGTYDKLVSMATTELLADIKPTQMVTLTPKLVVACLRSSFPNKWFNTSNTVSIISWNPDSPSHPPEKWINNIWHWINDNFQSLEQFEGIPLIPLQPDLGNTLGVLSKQSRFIFNSDLSQNIELPSQVVGLLKAAGCIVLPCVSKFLYVHHPKISSYVASPMVTEVTSMLGKCSMESAGNYIRRCSKDERKMIQRFFSASQEFSKSEKNILRCLPLLDTLDGSYTAALVSGQFLSVASSKFKLPDGFNFRKANQIISSAGIELLQLVHLLSLETIEPADIFSRFLFPDIQTRLVYNLKETTSIMLWILERKREIQNDEFLKKIKDLSFLSTRNGELKRPCELYDPSDPVLINLFQGEDSKFPSEEFSMLILTLKELGLRTQDMISASDLLGVAEGIPSSDSHSALKKVQALVTVFQQRPNFLQLRLGGNSLISKLAELKWLPRATEYPHETGYPNFMCNEWYSSETIFYKPDELFRESHTLLVGTSAPILGIEMNDDIQNLLGIQKQVNVDKVIEHLQTVVSAWQKEKRPNSLQYNEMLHTIYSYLSKVHSQDIVSKAIQRQDLVNWIWHGSGFCSPKQVALEKDLPFEFRPPLFLLPDMLNDSGTLTTFFQTHGVREQFSKEDIILVLAAVKKLHEDSTRQVSSICLEKDLKFCRSILEWLVNDGELSEDLRARVFVPVQSNENKLVLKECEKCTYCDQDWLKHGKTELDIPDDFHPVHEDITPKLAILLGVPSLSSCLLSSESIEFEQTGPYEPITTRIKNILKEYKEGVGIFKELIQNADDAGATTVKFLVDWRQGKTDSLFSPDMADSQGPALWAYNDAVFTDKDLENINKLAGRTKVEDLSKIGRFGLGFNAVYHLTDVPSFISRNYLCIFDPNVNHISNHIRNKSRPGIRIDLAKNSRPLTAFADQFSLFDQVFGCKTSLNTGEKFHYQGTLFRFPFRTECEAKKSEICDTVYNPSKVKKIVDTLQQSASLLLLFTQNVNHVELHELGSTGNPQDTTLVLSINKRIQNSINTVSEPSYIKQCSEWWQKKLKKLPSDESPSRLEQVKIVKKENPSTITDTETFLINSCIWLVAYCVGKDQSINFAAEEGIKDGLLPLAGAATLLQNNSANNMVDTKISAAQQIEGEAFCFLPLSIWTGLPIHVNSSFAVRSNRDGIWERTTAEENPESRWNDCLLQDAIPDAYFMLLSRLVDLSKSGSLPQFDQRFHDLWPRLENCRRSWRTLVSSFYTKMVQRDLKLFCSNGEWMNVTDGFILDGELREYQDDRVTKTLQSLGKYVFDLPPEVIIAMKNSVDSYVSTVIEKQTLSLLSFFEYFLFPNLPSISADLRNPIVHHGLHYIFQESREDWKQLKSLYMKTECIPCSPDGEKLARPCDLINPNVEIIAALYSPEENRFPFGELSDSQQSALEKLGMVKDLLSWKEICGRAKFIEELSMKDKDAALQRSRFLIKYLRFNIGYMQEKHGRLSSHLLENIKFLPVRLTPPATYTLPWKGAEFNTVQFRNPNNLFLLDDVNLIGSSCLIVDDTEQNGCGSLQGLENVLSFSKRPSCQQVLQQLEITKESDADNNVKIRVCKLVYRHLNDELTKNPDAEVIEKLQNMAWLFLDGNFVENKLVALNWKGYAVPFLYSVTDEYKRGFAELLKIIGIKKVFTPTDILQALDSLRESKKNSCMKSNDIDLVNTLINELKNGYNAAAVKQRVGTIPLPDTKGLLFNSEDLTIPERFHVKSGRNERYIHSDINQNIALKLGAKSLRTRRREKHGNTTFMSFGQNEKLTDRIRNILKSYPCDVGMLKELVQNADDAKATEVQFIYDKRTLPHERVLQDNAKKIQGPALCVYNNKHFSEDDFNGICKLGIGSKHDDPTKTGQYGIGFNAVYHLTDCPSFLSNDNDDITLCILDPHCEYSPEATEEAPGGRYDNIDDDFQDIFSDTLSGYLGNFGDLFPLQGSTIFRLPLRTVEQSKTSKISNRPFYDEDMIELLSKFQNEAKKLLLFLNHVKKIVLWEIDENCELKQMYSVSSLLEQTNEKKLHELHSHLQLYKEEATSAVPIKDTTYTICIQDTDKLEEEWLIHQRFGIKTETRTDEKTPNGCGLGLFPRGAIAALLSSNHVCSEEYVAYCFLPLPVKTSLPVNVNGHFALDGSRRNLWDDASGICPKTIWNTFMKKQVLGPAYASLITRAREYIPHCENDLDTIYFLSEGDTTKALGWYHNLFPNPVADPKWRILAVAVYQCLKETPVLPVVSRVHGTVVKDDKQGEYKPSKSPGAIFPRKSEKTPVFGKFSNYQPKYQEAARGSSYEHMKTARYATLAERRADAPTKYFIEWLPPNIVYFTQEKEREARQLLLAALLQIHMPVLLYTPMKIYGAMLQSQVESHLLSPENVIKFLLTSQDETSRCNIGKLPIQLNSSNIQNKSNLRSILQYCEEALKEFPKYIHGLPLLLTDDNVLRVFSSETPVYCSSFSELFPDKAFKFVQRDIVQLLSTFCVLQPDIIRNLTIQSLAIEFMPDVFSGKLNLGENVHVPWCYPEKGVLSKEWFRRLWEFLQKAAEKLLVVINSTDVSSCLLKFLGKYPIIPTINGNLATVDNAKTVLAVTNNKKGNYLGQKVSEILKSLACPFLDTLITKDALPVILRLVADPHRISDVLRVLDYMNSTGILDMRKFDDEKINTLLIYFQEDWQNQESMNIAKSLPFHKGVDGNHHSLSSYLSCIQVPVGLPEDGVKELQSMYRERVLFLPSLLSAEFNRLYKALGIMVDCSFSKFYITYVLPNFSSFSRKCQIEFLTNIKSAPYYMCDELKRRLKFTSCIPDQTGMLRVPSYYFNPHNELFKVMFGSGDNVFPTAPFNERDWVGFLVKIGMKKDCDEQQFIKFASGVEESARTMSTYDMNIILRSKALVKYLLESGRNWLNTSISQIEFIVPEEVENELSSVYSQYRVKEFVSFRNSVPWKHRHLAWTCVKLLPDWAYPDNINLVSSLAIPSKPRLESVIEHVKIISKCATDTIMSDSILPEKLIEVFKDVYAFLTEIMQNCAKNPPSPNCNEGCRNIGESLTNVACILLSKERRLVKGEGLSFEDTGEKLKPYFHMVPRDYSQYEHLFKRLGVTEKITASQMANVLESIKDTCAEITMNSEEEQKVCFATSVLLKSLHGSSTDVESRLSNCQELSLPSMKKRLFKSNELVCKMQPRLRESVEKQGYEILYPLEKCGLKRELEDAYINALPKRLRPTPLSSLVCEEVDPFCKRNMTCIYCTKMDCPFIQKFILLLRSSQFEHGILRLLKHQKERSTLDDEDRAKAARFTSTKLTVIKCMRQVQIHLVNAESKKSLPDSASVKTCQVEKQENSWTLYVQHEFGGRKHHAILAKAVNEIMDGCLKEIGELSDILSCDSPSEIPDVLNAHNVAPDYNEESEQLGQLVPHVYHYLMIQNPLCYFEEGTRVAYCNEGGERNWKPGEQEEESTTYTLAKILTRANAIDKASGEFDFNAEYKIDFGRKTDIKTVSVLDIYSYHQDDMGNPVSDDNVETQVDVVAEKSNITRALKLVKKLESLSRRCKVLRRLFLHWLRCKNAEVAAEMTTFIEDEVTRMEILRLEEARSYTSYWRSRGRRERTTFSSYNHWRSIGDHYTASEFVIPNKEEAERWIKQSKADLNVAAKMLSGKSYSQVCFMSQQCVEKVLKGVLYAKCGIPRRELRTHEISGLVSSASRLKGAPSELDRARKVANYYLPTRYPDNQPFPKVPVDEYSEKEAEEALNVAETVYTALEKFVHHNDD